MILCRTLGPVELTVDGGPAPPELLWRKHLALLIYLAASPRRTREREHLLGLLWQDKAETAARHSLNEAIRVIRRAAGDEALISEGSHLRLSVDSVRLDTELLAERLAAGDVAGAAALATGPFLEGLTIPGASAFEDWLASERMAWRRRSVQALIRHAEALLKDGRADDAVEEAGRGLQLDPCSEEAMDAAMRSLALVGDANGALVRFDEFSRRVAEELGVEPSAEIRGLADRLRSDRARRPHRGSGWRNVRPTRPPRTDFGTGTRPAGAARGLASLPTLE